MNISRWAWRCSQCKRFVSANTIALVNAKCSCGNANFVQIEITPKSWNEPMFMKDPIIPWEIKHVKR